jgi:WD40 repeat protein
LRLADVATGKQLRGFEQPATWGGFSADGRILFAGDSRTIHTWDVVTGKEVRRFLDEGRHSILAAAVSADGKTLATGEEDGTIRLWETATGKVRGTFRGHRGGNGYSSAPWRQGGVIALAWSADGKVLVSGGADTTVLVWDVSAAGR